MPLTAYGDETVKFDLSLENVNIEIRKGYEDIDLINACNFDTIKMKNVRVKNLSGECLVRTWSDGNIAAENVLSDKVKHLALKAKKAFFAESI